MSTPFQKTILIIDDDANLRGILTDKFSSLGFTVVEADNGKTGLEIFLNSAIDVILLDLYMPIMDGHVFLENLRKTPKGKEMPVIVLSNMVDRDYVVEAFGKKITDYLLKANTELDVIVERVKKAAKV